MNVSIKRHLSGRNIFPAMLNSRSTVVSMTVLAGGYITCDFKIMINK